MLHRLIISWTLLLIVSTQVSAGIFGDAIPDNSLPSLPNADVGEESLKTSRLQAENTYLRELVLHQDKKIQILESRIKELESKK